MNAKQAVAGMHYNFRNWKKWEIIQ